MKILIVDDVKEIAQLLSQFIEIKLQIKPTIAYNGQEALDLTKKTSFDLIITDIDMPIMNGIQFISSLSEKKIIYIMTGYNKNEEFSSLSNRFYNKPLKLPQLLEDIKNDFKL